jgi:hypothetical protein
MNPLAGDFECSRLIATVTFSLEIRDQLGVEWPRPNWQPSTLALTKGDQRDEPRTTFHINFA